MAERISQGRGQALHFGMAAKMKGMTPTVNPASSASLRAAHRQAHQLYACTSAR